MAKVEVPDEIVPKNDGDFALLDAANLRGGWRAVATIIARDAIPADNRSADMHVFVTEDGVTYKMPPGDLNDNLRWVDSAPATAVGNYVVVSTVAERDVLVPSTGDIVNVLQISQKQEFDGSAWRTKETGNPALLATLNSPYAILGLNVHSTAGSDVTGTGTLGNPFATWQRAFDEASYLGVQGYLVITTLDSGPQAAISTRHFKKGGGAQGLVVYIVAYRALIETITLTGASTQITNGAGHYVSTRLAVASAPFATAIDEHEHWLYQGFDYLGVDFPGSFFPVGTAAGTSTHESNPAGGILAIMTGEVPVYAGDYDLCAFTTVVTPHPDDVDNGIIELHNGSYEDGLAVNYYGCTFEAFVTATHTSVHNCRIQGGTYDFFAYGKCDIKLVNAGSGDVHCFSPQDTTINVISTGDNVRIDPTSFRNTGNGSQVLNLGPCLMRGSHADKLRIGNSQYGSVNVVHASGLDFVGGTQRCIYLRNCSITLNSAEALACENTQADVIDASDNARINIGPSAGMYGTTASDCFVLNNGASLKGVAALAGKLSSTAGATREVKLGSNAGVAFSTGPAGDVVSGTRFS